MPNTLCTAVSQTKVVPVATKCGVASPVRALSLTAEPHCLAASFSQDLIFERALRDSPVELSSDLRCVGLDGPGSTTAAGVTVENVITIGITGNIDVGTSLVSIGVTVPPGGGFTSASLCFLYRFFVFPYSTLFCCFLPSRVAFCSRRERAVRRILKPGMPLECQLESFPGWNRSTWQSLCVLLGYVGSMLRFY